MQQKPALWNVTPALIAPEARGLWKGVAFAMSPWRTIGKAVLLNPRCAPYLSSPAPTFNGTAWKASPYGIALGNNSSDNRRILYTGFAPLTTSNGAGTGDFTLLQLSNPATGDGSTSNAGVSQRLASGNFNQANLQFNCDTGYNYVNQSFAFATYETAASGVSAASMVDGKWHLWGGVRRGGSMYAWRDGVIVASASPTLRNVYNASADFCIGGTPNAATYGLPNTADTALTIGWNRALSDAEMRLLARDPFIMFRPVAEWRKVWTPLGGDAVLSPSDLTFEFAFETPALSQSHVLPASDASLGEGFEAPAISQIHILNLSELAFAENLESAGFSQAHLLALQEMHLAELFDLAVLAMDLAGAPGFRTSRPATRGKVKVTGTDNRTTQPQSGGRRKSITE